jgi:hypothetical protein
LTSLPNLVFSITFIEQADAAAALETMLGKLRSSDKPRLLSFDILMHDLRTLLEWVESSSGDNVAEEYR